MVRAMSAVGVLNFSAKAGKEGRRIFSGKKLINEILVIRTKRETRCRFRSVLRGGQAGSDIVFIFQSDQAFMLETRNRY